MDTVTVSGQAVATVALGDGDDSIVFTARELNLTLNGGDGSDQIQGSAGNNAWLLGSGGQHQLVTSGANPEVDGTLLFAEMEVIIGDPSAADSLTGTDSTTHWQIDAGNQFILLGQAIDPNSAAGAQLNWRLFPFGSLTLLSYMV